MKKVLVTGACGFVGSHLVELLMTEGFDVRATDLEWANRRHIQRHIESGSVEYMSSDLRKSWELDSVVKDVEIVFHPGGLFNLTIDRETLNDVNVKGTFYLCLAAADRGVRKLINWSSSSIYGCWGDDRAATEEDEIFPERMHNDYARSKYEQEKTAQKFGKTRGIKVISIRPADIYGQRTVMGSALPLKSLAAGVLQRPPAIKGKNGEYLKAKSSHVHVKDVARAALFLALSEEAEGVYNVSEDEAIYNEELFRRGAEVLGKEIKTGYENPIIFRMIARLLGAYASTRNFLSSVSGNPERIYPPFDAASVDFMVKNHIVSNRRLRKLGFEFKHKMLEEVPGLAESYRSTKLGDVFSFARYRTAD